MRIIQLVSFTLVCAVSFSQQAETFHPIFRPKGLKVAPFWSSNLINKFDWIRVKVFPHNSKYNAPHGKDTVIDKVNIQSAGKCSIYNALTESSELGINRGTAVATGSYFKFDAAKLASPVWLECNQPVSIVREGFNKANFYDGYFFIKKIVPKSGVPYLTIVNVIQFESYLKGVVPAEMPASWSPDSLMAQAIAARTYAYFELATNEADDDENILVEKSGAQLDDTVTYQAYLGFTNSGPSSDTAVQKTENQVMTYKGYVIKSFFSADSGGYTEDSANIWGEAYDYIKAKPEIYPKGSVPGSDWSIVMDLDKIRTDLVEKSLILPSAPALTKIEVLSPDVFPSGRAKWVTITDINGKSLKISGVDFSYAVGLRSNWIQFSAVGKGSVRITGHGYGHGAGMSQWGAKIMIENLKWNPIDTLKFYYSGIDIQ